MKKDNLRKTFEKAKEINRLKPWEWMSDLDIFAVRVDGFSDPIFISILGQAGELAGISMYTDPEGLSGLFYILDNYNLDEVSILHNQKFFALYFNDRDELSSEEYSIVKQSGVGFRGKNAWPSFITCEPGYLPKVSDDYIYEFMPDLLDAIIDCCKFLKDNLDKANLFKVGKYYFRDYKSDNTFLEKIMTYDDYFKNTYLDIELHQTYNDLDIQRLKKQGKRFKTTWELGMFYHFMPVEDEYKPYFPAISLIIDFNSKLVIGQHLSHPNDRYPEFQRYLVDMMIEDKKIPTKINVSDIELFTNLEELCDILSIELNLVEELIEMEMAKEAFLNFFQ